jgi:Domain of unknown function (DUF4340)
MRTRKVLIYLSILALLAAYLYYFEGIREKARLSEEERARLLFQVEPGKISALRLSPTGGKPLALVRDGQWRLTEPIQSPADEFVLRGLLAALAGLKTERQVEAAARDLRPYGLDRPTLHLAFEAEGRWHNLRVGAATPVGDHFYASGDEETRVVLVGASQESALNKSLSDFRGKELFTLRTEAVDRIDISRSEGAFVLTRSETKGWQAAGDPALNIKTAKVESLLNQLTSLRASRFVDEAEAAKARLGLNPPRLRLSLSAKELRETLLVGASGPNRGIYAKSDHSPGICLVDADALKKVPAGLGELEDRALLSFETEQVARLEVKLAANAVELERQDDTWKRVEGQGGKPSEEWRVNALLRRVQELEYIEGAPPTAQEPDDGAPLRLVLASRGGERIAAISVNGIPAGKERRGVLWIARGSEAPKAYLVEADALRSLERRMKHVLISD